MSAQENPWLPRRPLREDAALRLFCFPHAGGATSVYHRWAGEFPAAIDVVPILLPGRERRLAESPIANVGELTKALADAISSHFDKPFVFFGHSMGALVAFELARRLRQKPPQHLFVAAYRAPQLAARRSPMHALPDAEFVAAIQERFGGIPEEIAENPELLALFLPALRADVAAIETYNYDPAPPLECPITTLGGVEDRQVSAADLAAWRSQTTGDFAQKMLPGGHFFVTQSSIDVARIVRSRLERCLT
jgi:medium-chain acyl-[acyl-carrier-protein] hydrolase